jgi:Citrate synthase, C-terminal domain
MKGPELLRANVGRITSRVGAAFLGSHTIFRGKNLHKELGEAGWIDLYLYGITGRRFSAPQLRVLEAMWIYTSYPDTRIWNNRVAALAGSTRSTGTLGLSAALAVSEAEIYGQGACYRAIEFLIRLRAHVDAGGELGPFVRKELSERRALGGYGRPVNGGTDERIAPLLALAQSLGLSDGPHLKLAFEVEEFLLAKRLRLRMNFAAFVSGLSADVGLSPKEQYCFFYPCFLAGMVPCYLDAADRAEGTLLPLPCDAVAHTGVPKRTWRRVST